MGGKLGRKFAAVVIAFIAVSAFAAVASPSGAADQSLLRFNYRVDATTHIQKLDQTIVVNGGTFAGFIDFTNAGPESLLPLRGNIVLPPANFTLKAAGFSP